MLLFYSFVSFLNFVMLGTKHRALPMLGWYSTMRNIPTSGFPYMSYDIMRTDQ